MLRLDRTGYVPGEDINLDAEIQNQSRREIDSSYVTMQQVRISRIVLLRVSTKAMFFIKMSWFSDRLAVA